MITASTILKKLGSFSVLLGTAVVAQQQGNVDDLSRCLLLSETVNELDEETNKFSSDQSLAALLTADHVVVETGGCYDDGQVYSLHTVYGVYDSATGNVR